VSDDLRSEKQEEEYSLDKWDKRGEVPIRDFERPHDGVLQMLACKDIPDTNTNVTNEKSTLQKSEIVYYLIITSEE
jgi:hypothetical protein